MDTLEVSPRYRIAPFVGDIPGCRLFRPQYKIGMILGTYHCSNGLIEAIVKLLARESDCDIDWAFEYEPNRLTIFARGDMPTAARACMHAFPQFEPSVYVLLKL